jgi:hypothetical protein
LNLGQVLALVCAHPVEECKPHFVQTLAIVRRTWGTPHNKAKSSLVQVRDRLDSTGLRGKCAVLGSAEVCRRCPIGQRTTKDHCGWGSVPSQIALDEDEEDCLPEPWAARLLMERVTRIFSVRMREAVDIEGIAEDICRCESAKQKVIQEGCLDLEERQASSLRMDSLDLTQSASYQSAVTRGLHRSLACMTTSIGIHTTAWTRSRLYRQFSRCEGCGFARYAPSTTYGTAPSLNPCQILLHHPLHPPPLHPRLDQTQPKLVSGVTVRSAQHHSV